MDFDGLPSEAPDERQPEAEGDGEEAEGGRREEREETQQDREDVSWQ